MNWNEREHKKRMERMDKSFDKIQAVHKELFRCWDRRLELELEKLEVFRKAFTKK